MKSGRIKEGSRERYFFSQTALLCGSPGLGKTTLAHIIAQHAGYNAVEMNARCVCVCVCVSVLFIHTCTICFARVTQ